MKFNPELPSFLIALNQPTREEDLALIADFYEGEVIELVGFWKGKEERSYQVPSNSSLDCDAMVETLKFVDQDAFILINTDGLEGAWSYNFLYMSRDCHPSYLGKMTMVPTKQGACTYCPSTHTYWKAL